MWVNVTQRGEIIFEGTFIHEKEISIVCLEIEEKCCEILRAGK